MFFPGSRYIKQPQYQTTLPDGTVVTAVAPPLPGSPVILGYHARQQGQRLDLLANYFLQDATQFWLFCDANNAMVPDALATHDQIAVPKGS